MMSVLKIQDVSHVNVGLKSRTHSYLPRWSSQFGGLGTQDEHWKLLGSGISDNCV